MYVFEISEWILTIFQGPLPVDAFVLMAISPKIIVIGLILSQTNGKKICVGLLVNDLVWMKNPGTWKNSW